MKKIISLLLVFAMVFAVVACNSTGTTETTETTVTTGTTESTAGTTAGTTGTTETTGTTGSVTPPPAEGFDENNVVLSFAAISDIHIETSGSSDKFAKALKTLAAYASGRNISLDSIVIAGDICQTTSQISTFKSIYESSGIGSKLFFTLGNHDQESNYQGEALTLTHFKNVLGDSYFSESDNLSTGDRHMSITDKNGKAHHFIVIQPKSYGNTTVGDKVSFHDSSVAWLDAKLAEITAQDPGAYVYVFTHAMIADTCYGSDLDVSALYGNKGNGNSYWYTGDLTSTLEKYPQVVTFSGHLHFPINDERSIMQDKFTSLGTGSVANLAIEGGYGNANGTRPAGYTEVSSGHVVEIDANGNVRITRLNLATGENFGAPWTLDAPKEDGSHLTKYSKARKDTNQAPSMAGSTPVVSLVKVNGNIFATLSFDAGTDDSFVHHYKIKVTNAKSGAIMFNRKWLSDFYLEANPENRAKTLTISIGRVISGKSYKVEITAVDSWGAESETLTATFTASDNFDGTLPNALVDIDFNEDGTVTDKKGVATVELVGGATVSSENVTFGGVTKPMAGLHSKASGQSGTLTFNTYSLSDMDALYNGNAGFSFEVLYVNRAKSGTQGIFCATESGGVGFAEQGSGKPGFCVYAGNNSWTYTADTQVASTTELTHVVCTAIYDGSSIYTGIYVNGALADSKVISGKVWMTDSKYKPYANQISICNDIGTADFPTTDCTVVDVKVYAQCLNAEQVKTAYNNAAALFAN
jgi:hypothetical protein